jgi:hypothetical protein
MAGKATGRMKFSSVLSHPLEPISADCLEKMPEAYPLKLWVKDSPRVGVGGAWEAAGGPCADPGSPSSLVFQKTPLSSQILLQPLFLHMRK